MPAPPAAIQIRDDDRVVASAAAADLVGRPAGEAPRPLAEWVAPGDRPTADALLRRVRGGEVGEVSVRVRAADDAPLWVTLWAEPDGRVAGHVRTGRGGLGRDDAAHADRLRLLATVTSQGDLPFHDQVGQALALTTTLLGLDMGILSQIERGDDGDGDYTVVACHGADLAPGTRFDLGDTYCSITVEGRDLFEIDHVAVSPHRRHPCYRAFGVEAYVGMPVHLGGGAWGTLCFSAAAPLAAPLTDADHDLIRVLAAWVSGALDRRARVEALAARDRHLRAVVEQAPIVLYALDADGVFTLSEGRGLGALGLAPGEVVGHSVFELYADAPEATAPLRRVLAGEERTWTSQVGAFHYEAWATPTFDAAGRVAGATGVSIDVTDLREAEDRLEREAARLHRLLGVTAVDGPLSERGPAVLATVAGLLGLDAGFLGRVRAGVYTCLAAHPAGAMAAGDELPRALTVCDLTLAAGDVVAVEHVGASEHRDHPCYAARDVEAYVGAPVVVDGETWGTLSFTSARPAPRPFSASDADLVRLAAQWAGGLVERDLRRKALAESERRLRALGRSTTEGIAFAAGGVVVDCNDQFARLFGLADRAAAVGRTPMSFVAPEHAEVVRATIEAGGTDPYEIVGVRADGSRFWMEAQGGQTTYGGREVRMTAVRDVTARRLAEEQTQFQADVLAQVSDSVVALDLDGRVTYWNGGAERLHGVAEADALGRRLEDVIEYRLPDAPHRPCAAGAEGLLRSEAARNGELVYLTPGGDRRFVSVSSSVLRDSHGVETGLLAVARDVTPRRELATRLQFQATHDDLTGLPNRALFRDRIDRATASGDPFGVLFVDLDRFKVVNDSLGHDAGDRLLEAVASRLRRALGAYEDALVARLGGDEFGVIVPTAGGDAEGAGRAVLDALAEPVDLGERSVLPGASVGVVEGGEAYALREALLRDADTAMYAAKRAGRGVVAVFDPSMHEAAAARFGLEHDLREAVAGDQLRAVFQPIVDLSSGGVVGFESLVRWAHPERGLLGPGEFLPVAEEVGLVPDVDRWVLDETCREIGRWAPHLDPDALLWVSVNCSDRTFLSAGLAERARGAAEAAGLDPGRLVLELTERALVDADAAREALAAVRAAGLQLCVDDFGSGYSSLGLLHALPVDGLKIDRSFVSDLGASRAARSVVRAVVQIANDLGLRVVAEGIETEAQLAVLRELGCPLGQGYLFSKPVPPDEARALIAAPPWNR